MTDFIVSGLSRNVGPGFCAILFSRRGVIPSQRQEVFLLLCRTLALNVQSYAKKITLHAECE